MTHWGAAMLVSAALAASAFAREHSTASFGATSPSALAREDPTHHEFTFTRIRYSGNGRGFGGSAWAHDYPRGDEHLSKILEYLTLLDTNVGPTNVFDLDNPALFDHPIAYLSEPGFWSMSDAEAQGLRSYLLKGGFLIFDDFEAEQWHNFEAQLRRAMPDHRLIPIDVTHPIFHSFFELTRLDVPHPLVRVEPEYFGLFEQNDPRRRMMAIVNYNNDLAEYWEFADTGMFALDLTNDAYKLGVNYIVYGLTH
jgi:hypothetical protein